jgi:hypothetical protein
MPHREASEAQQAASAGTQPRLLGLLRLRVSPRILCHQKPLAAPIDPRTHRSGKGTCRRLPWGRGQNTDWQGVHSHSCLRQSSNRRFEQVGCRRLSRHTRERHYVENDCAWPDDSIARNQVESANCFSEHYSVCEFTRWVGLPVRAFADLVAYHEKPPAL